MPVTTEIRGRQGREPRTSLLIEMPDRPGALASALEPFTRHRVNLTHIESRPARGDTFDFYVDCEGVRGDPTIEKTIAELERISVKLLVLDERKVTWFPRHVSELDLIAGNTLDAGSDLQADHPGFSDPDYRERRARIDALARAHTHGAALPVVAYSESELATWRVIYPRLRAAHRKHACVEYARVLDELERRCGYGVERIPQSEEVSRFLELRTGFRIRPVAGLLSPRDFLNGLAFRVFFATQYIRHHSKPLYTPEPDVVHELVGHAPMFADPAFADLSQEIGLASLGATDADIERLSRCYWHSVEFGLVQEGTAVKAYGAGLLSSFGEIEWAVTGELTQPEHEPERKSDRPEELASTATRPEFKPWAPEAAAEQDYPITDYQPVYFVAESLQDAKSRMREFCRNLTRPFYARYNPATERIWVDRAVRRQTATE